MLTTVYAQNQHHHQFSCVLCKPPYHPIIRMPINVVTYDQYGFLFKINLIIMSDCGYFFKNILHVTRSYFIQSYNIFNDL